MTTSLHQSVPRAFVIFPAKSDRADIIAINTIILKLDFLPHWQKKKLSSPNFTQTTTYLYFIVVSEKPL